jgi:two-component SAPR family response regulator
MSILIISENNQLVDLLSQQPILPEGILFIGCRSVNDFKGDIADKIVIYDGGNFQDDKAAYKKIVLGSSEDGLPDISYLSKPVRLADLFYLLSGFINDIQKNSQVVSIGIYGFDYVHKTLKCGNEQIDLTEKEAEIIKVLSSAYPKSLGKNELLNMAWGYDGQIDTNTLETHIYRLRKKITGNGEFIESDKDGYKINKILS